MAKQEIGDLEIIRQKLEQWLASRLGISGEFSLGELNFPESSGESSVTLMVEATWPEAGAEQHEKFVLRMVPPDSQVFESHDLELQYDLMDLMNRQSVPAPGLVGYESDESIMGSDFYVMRFTEGQIPPDNPPMAFGSWVLDLSPEQRAEMWSNGLQTMAKIHCIDIEKNDLPSLPRSAADGCPIAHEIEKFDSIIAWGMRENADPIILKAWQFLKDTAPQQGVRRLCWGDSRGGNMIWQDLKPVAVIDWEMASIGDPQMDLAWWFWIDHCNSVGLGTEKMSGLPEFSDAYQQWHEITGLPIDDIAWYELFCVVRFAIIMERKLLAAQKVSADFGEMESHPVKFIEPLMAACQ